MPEGPLRDLRTLGRRVMHVQRARAGGVLAITVVNMAAQGITVALLVPLLRVAGVPTSGGVVGAIDRGIQSAFHLVGLRPTLPAVLALFIAVAWAQAMLEHVELVQTTRLEQEIVRDLREALYGQLLAARWQFFTERRGSHLTHAVTRDTDRAGAAVGYLLRGMAQSASVVIYG
ncbi:MAG: hypothetical protein ACREN3_13470, partial [Gemmatimonadaceae bacterium]